jgi:hypothetical protein
LIRHRLVTPQARKRTRSDYKRWERSRAMELWQMDIVGGVRLIDGSEAKIVSGIDDHSRFVISAYVVARATAKPTCDALALAMRRHGVPDQVLTDNGKVFTARFGLGPGPVLFDRICNDNGIRHILTAPRSPTTTGKIERWHKTLRREFLDGKTFASIVDAQAQLDAWVHEYNHRRPHQSLGGAVPFERFRLARSPSTPVVRDDAGDAAGEASEGPVTTRRVGGDGTISFAAAKYKAGRWLAGQNVEVVCDGGLPVQGTTWTSACTTSPPSMVRRTSQAATPPVSRTCSTISTSRRAASPKRCRRPRSPPSSGSTRCQSSGSHGRPGHPSHSRDARTAPPAGLAPERP